MRIELSPESAECSQPIHPISVTSREVAIESLTGGTEADSHLGRLDFERLPL